MNLLRTLELPAEWKLDPRDIDVKNFQKGEYIVKPGEDDDSIYVAIDGILGVYIAVRCLVFLYTIVLAHGR